MYLLPAKNTVVLSLLALALTVLSGCAKVSVNRASTTYAARNEGCSLSWEHAEYSRVASQYEWLGEVTLRNERGVVLTEGDRALVEAQACQLGGDTLVRTTAVKQQGSGVAAFSDQRFGVLRRRPEPAASGAEGEPASELPRHGAGGDAIAQRARRPSAAVR